MSPSVGAIFVVHAYDVMDNSVDFLFVCGSNFYACFFENLFKMSKVACHGCVPLESSVLGGFVNFVLRLASQPQWRFD